MIRQLESKSFLFFLRDHLRSTLGITCGRGSFAVHFGDHLRSRDHLRLGIICGTVHHYFKNRLDQNRKLRIKSLWYTKSQITQINVYRNGAKYLGIHPQRPLVICLGNGNFKVECIGFFICFGLHSKRIGR